MEEKSHNIITTMDNKNNNRVSDHVKLQKKRSAVNIFKAASFMLRFSKKTKPLPLPPPPPPPVDVGPKGKWKRLLGSMRPLHLQSNQSPPPALPSTSSSPVSEQYYEDVLPAAPMSPAGVSTSSCSEDSMSWYASAVNLQELDRPNEDEYVGDDENDGDEMIDEKAEEFIAQFYAQMKLQRMNSVDRRYREMSERSIS